MMRGKIVILMTGVLLLSMTAGGSAHGQLWIGEHWPALAYNPVTQAYIEISQPFGLPAPAGRHIDPWGTPLYSIGLLSLSYTVWDDEYSKPSIAYDSINNRFLIAWTGPWPYNNLYGQILGAGGHPVDDTSFPISTAPAVQAGARVTFDTANERFLVTWIDYRTDGRPALYGQLVDANGALQGEELFITGGFGREASYSIAHDDVNRRFLAVCAWNGDLSAQLISAEGTPEGGKISIVENSSCPVGSTSVAYDSANRRYLAAYDGTCGWGFIDGQLINADGTLHQAPFLISPSGHNPAIAYDSINQRFLAAWTVGNTYSRFVNPDGTPLGEAVAVSRKGKLSTENIPAITFNPQCGNFLVAGTSVKTFPTPDVWVLESIIESKVVGDPCLQAVLTVRKQGVDRQKWHLSGAGLKCTGNLCKGKYIQGSTVSITADVTVSAWTGCDTLENNVCSVVMDGKKTVTATLTKSKGIVADTTSGF
jgi:hypothetical protein